MQEDRNIKVIVKPKPKSKSKSRSKPKAKINSKPRSGPKPKPKAKKNSKKATPQMIEIMDPARVNSPPTTKEELIKHQNRVFPLDEMSRQVIPVPTFFNAEAMKATEARVESYREQLAKNKEDLKKELEQQKHNINMSHSIAKLEANQKQMQQQSQTQGQVMNLNVSDLTKKNDSVLDLIKSNKSKFLKDIDKDQIEIIKSESNLLTHRIKNLDRNTDNTVVINEIKKKLKENNKKITSIYRKQIESNIKQARIESTPEKGKERVELEDDDGYSTAVSDEDSIISDINGKEIHREGGRLQTALLNIRELLKLDKDIRKQEKKNKKK